MKKVTIISTSLRNNSNSDLLAQSFMNGAKSAGHDVTYISLRDKQIAFCKGCLACQSLGHCVIQDDVKTIEDAVLNSDVVVFATPIYYYEMSGQMKTLIDRLNPMFSKDYKFRDAYLLMTAAEDAEEVPARTMSGFGGWIACFEKCRLAGSIFCGGVTNPNDIADNPKLAMAYEMGAKV